MTIGIGALTQQPVRANDWYAHAFARGWSEHYEELERREARWTDCYGANFSFPPPTLREIGGFSIDLAVAEDFDIAFRLWQAGCAPPTCRAPMAFTTTRSARAGCSSTPSRQGEVQRRAGRGFPETTAMLLDWRGSAGRRELALRRLCLALRVAARVARLAGPPPPRQQSQDGLAALRPPARLLGWGPGDDERHAVVSADPSPSAARQARAGLAAGAAGG